ncbi:uncharacterized protein PFL1_05090 [Pseudozyma flocculosa PF-1]|uniref:Related to SAM50 - essential component of the SAM or TOB complex of the mitochondrial outer membrane n=2 Tax=Pseudozyma flocculosa TaxID=84751 RepID=A0A5C3EY08_9BASI|nr:uncharacterized protein PFL1_05090 [Pseudozyma flocculosa PF-1]EPQ27552.1 hypothetical protein PFL1_05090 [Pseudozyma flocculosa PF-1]SPO36009.1 related to SAM50 - essential component of the SAM or TOB complex of the mitochondrial outer membrane [Pseudozyma flocculosa]
MEFNTLKEERSRQQPDAASKASSSTASAGSPSSTAPAPTLRSQPASTHAHRSDFPPQTDADAPPIPPDAPVPSAAHDDAPLDAQQPPLPEHNLLRATQLLQGGPSNSPFAPNPILRLSSIRIVGATSLRPSFLATLCRPYLDPALNAQTLGSLNSANTALYGSRMWHPLPYQPTTLPSIMNLTGSIVEDLTKLDIFQNIDATLAPSLAPDATEEDVDVILSCKPKGRIFLKSSTDVGNGEGSASVQGRIRNVFGGAETLQGSATFGTRTKQAFNLQFAMPLLANADHVASLTAFSSERDLTAFSSAFESIKGFKAAVSSNVSASPAIQHEFAYEASLRGLGRLLPDASISMRKLATQPTVKSSLSHTVIQDTRDDPVLPGSGAYFKLVQELAGFGGDASHYRAEMELSLGRRWTWPFSGLLDHLSSADSRNCRDAKPSPFLDETSRSSSPAAADLPSASAPTAPMLPTSTMTFRSGLLRTLNGAPSLYSDRFQLGGPTCVRMFRLNGLGPKDKLDSLGGDAFWSFGVDTNFNIPKREEWPLKMHAFANAGQLVQLDMAKPVSASLSPLLQPSVSAGVGLVYLQGPLRVELNAGLPLAARRSDSIRKGLQLGVGISFL